MVGPRAFWIITAALCFALGFTTERALSPGTANSGLIYPSARDLLAARPSDILRAGAARDEEVRTVKADTLDHNRYAIHPFYRWNTGEEELKGARAGLARALGGERKRAFLGKGMAGGIRFELYLELKRDARSPAGVKGRLLRLDRLADGIYFDQSGAHDDVLSSYNHAQDALLFSQPFGRPIAHHLYQDARAEFPLRSEKEFPGRYFAWNVDREEYDIVSAVRWKALSRAEAAAYVAEYGTIWSKSDINHRGPYTGGRPPASPPIEY